ncbi:MRG-domain-containing protein [Pilobolus umbonatus]|nr:MRG-domain-containing protein [Pilobolus umbonatus]
MPKDDNKFNYDKDERVLCYHGSFLYEAKILKKEKREEDSCQYFVHYKGWKQTWDEWVTEDRMMKYNETNLQKQKHIKESNTRRKPSRSSLSNTSLQEQTESRSRKRYRDSSLDKIRLQEEDKRPEVKIVIPESLKSLLVDDWENITKNRQILCLPRDMTVNRIFEAYKAQTTEKDETLDEYIKGLLLYFNKSLGTSLLYRSERKQYEEMCIDKEPSEIYGVEHLLRLFVECPVLINQANIDPDTLAEFKEKCESILR